MRIGIDISAVVYGTGVSVYTQELVRALLAEDNKNEYVLFGGSLRRAGELRKFTSTLTGNFTAKIIPLAPTAADIMWNKLHVWPIERFIGHVDVFHSSDWTQPPTNAKKVTTIHDMAPFVFKNETHPKIYATHTRRISRIRQSIDAVIVPSAATKRDVLKLEIPENNIHVVPEALRSDFPTSSRYRPGLRGKSPVKGKYLLTVGTAGRKNIDRTIEAFQKVKGNLGIDQLVVVGQSKDRNSDGVVFTGHISNAELEAYYAHAEALVYASLYEGFGLPILEAFASGTPVVTSDRSSLPEVAGTAAILVDPKDVKAIAQGILTALKKRSDLVKKGKQQLKKFSWQKAAKQTLNIYNSVV